MSLQDSINRSRARDAARKAAHAATRAKFDAMEGEVFSTDGTKPYRGSIISEPGDVPISRLPNWADEEGAR